MATKTTKTAKTTKTTKASTRKSPSTKRTVAEPSTPRVVETAIPDNYAPIGMWGYFGYSILFMIPLIGWILCIGFALTARNYNLRNYARSQFCWLIIYVIIFCALAGIGALRTVFEAFGVI